MAFHLQCLHLSTPKYFSWELPPSYFFKIDFNDSVQNQVDLGRSSFVIRSAASIFIIVGSFKIFDTIVPVTKFLIMHVKVWYIRSIN